MSHLFIAEFRIKQASSINDDESKLLYERERNTEVKMTQGQIQHVTRPDGAFKDPPTSSV